MVEVIHDRTEMAKLMRYPTGDFIVVDDIIMRTNEIAYFGNENNSFQGTIDFQGHTLKQYLTKSEYLFSGIGSSAVIENLIFDTTMACEVPATSVQYYCGMVFYNHGTLRNIVINMNLGQGMYRKTSSGSICYQNLGTIENFVLQYSSASV